MEKNSTTADMKTLASCLNRLVSDGFTQDFKATDKGLVSLQTNHSYSPQDVQVVNYFRFEGASDPADNSILYAILASDGTRGTLIDAFGPYADNNVSLFMKEVEDMTKKTV